MLIEKQRRKEALIERLVDHVRGMGGADAERIARFVGHLYAQVPPVDLLDEPFDRLCGAALSIWKHAFERPPDGAKIRIYNPRQEDHGWSSSHTIIELVNDDMPFLVDSVAGALSLLDARVRLIIHPVLSVQRDAEHRIVEIGEEARAGGSESWMQVQVDEQAMERHEEIRLRLERVLEDVRIIVGDWQAMRERCDEIIEELVRQPPPVAEEDLAEGIAFLRWLNDDHFTYLGAREYQFEGHGPKAVARVPPESGLGLLRDIDYTVFDGLRHLGGLPRDVRHFVRQPELLRITKANRRASVHRTVYLDTVAIKRFNADGEVIGERLFIGLFTSVTYSVSVRDIPILRQRVANTMKHSGLLASSHDGRALLHILESYPRDELFQITERELLEISTGILHLQERQRIALFVRRDPFERFVSCLIFVPRDRYDTALRVRLQDLVAAAYRGKVMAYYTHLTDAPLARVHCIVKTQPGQVPDVDASALEAQLIEAGHSWDARLERLLVGKLGEERGIRCACRFAKAFPPSYRDLYDENDAVLDIGAIEEAISTESLATRLYRQVAGPHGEIQFKMFTVGRAVPLSDVMPMLENMGLKVLDEVPFYVQTTDVGPGVCIRDFRLAREDGGTIDLAQIREPFRDAFGRVWRGDMANDGFNRLVLRASLGARGVTVLRAYSRYLHQLRAPFSQSYIEDTLVGSPALTQRLVDLFRVRFDPEQKQRHIQEELLASEVEELLEQVPSLDEDRILRSLLNLIQSTVRTNGFQLDAEGRAKSYLTLKLDTTRIDVLPSPRPFREIFVYSPKVEAVHLRGGRVARGGIRWSDRRDDFRTEILGLMKAQMTKNAVIVPVGAKGGFVVQRPPDEREALQREVVECYRTMIRGLLDVTDNRQGDRIVPPPQVVCHDIEDPYLVVAADKGTATFSDIANALAEEYGFWLGDAFASGGSAGYDHKKMGITARGAWESVKRHFRELGKNVQDEDFTVVGIGDMAGDVFGNGMLLSRHTCLLGAFNHRHIFVDPEPDPEASFAERQRLFSLPGSSWDDYDRGVLSAGGGVFDRAAKSILLSPQIQVLLEIERDRLTPNELIRALLRAPAELLWFGGIGTFVRASSESDADVGDRPNDAVRIRASELRVRVVGEGANLGMTQLARIEFALGGGCVNTDAVDNSAGVGSSDREVNLKILFGEVEAAGDLTRKQRNDLLAEMADEVATLVVRDNTLQNLSLSVTRQLGSHLLHRLARIMHTLEKRQRLDRRLEFLPDEEAIEERAQKSQGFTRPELAVLLAYAKNELYDELLASDLADDPFVEGDLQLYFPTRLRATYGHAIAHHRLRREIIATLIANEMLNRAGLGFVQEVQEKSGCQAGQVARAYVVAREILEMRLLWQRIESLDHRVRASVQAAMLAECGRLIERITVWLLREAGTPLDIGREIEVYASGIRQLSHELEELAAPEATEAMAERARRYQDAGVEGELARRVAGLPLLVPACDMVRIGLRTGLAFERVARMFFVIGDRFGFDWLRRAANQLPRENAWDKLAVSALVDDLIGHQSELTATVLQSSHQNGDPLALWAARHESVVHRTDQLLSELRSLGSPGLSMLAVANRQLKAMSVAGWPGETPRPSATAATGVEGS